MRSALIRRSKPSGFTLIELMVVIVLIAIMSTMIIPEMQGTYDDAILRSSSRSLVNLLNMTSTRSVTANQIFRVRFDLTTGQYCVEKCVRERATEYEFAPLTGDSDYEGKIDSRLTLSALKPEEIIDNSSANADGDVSDDQQTSDYSTGNTAKTTKKMHRPSAFSTDSTAEDEDEDEDEDMENSDDEDTTEEDPSECIVQFYPDGTADRKVLILEDRAGFRRAFQINPYTSRVLVLDAGRRL